MPVFYFSYCPASHAGFQLSILKIWLCQIIVSLRAKNYHPFTCQSRDHLATITDIYVTSLSSLSSSRFLPLPPPIPASVYILSSYSGICLYSLEGCYPSFFSSFLSSSPSISAGSYPAIPSWQFCRLLIGIQGDGATGCSGVQGVHPLPSIFLFEFTSSKSRIRTNQRTNKIKFSLIFDNFRLKEKLV